MISKLCEQYDVKDSVTFLNQRIQPAWKDQCCLQHSPSFVGGFVFRSILGELNASGQLPPQRLLDLVIAVKRLTVIFSDETDLSYGTVNGIITDFLTFTNRYLHYDVPFVCHSVVFAFENFVQTLAVQEGSALDAVREVIKEILLARLTKYSIRCLIAVMRWTTNDIFDDDISWINVYDQIGNSQVNAALTDLIVFHAAKLVTATRTLGPHMPNVKRVVLTGNCDSRRAIQTKLFPKMFKSVELRGAIVHEFTDLLSLQDEQLSNDVEKSERVLESVLSVARFMVFNPYVTAITNWRDCVSIKILAKVLLGRNTELRLLAWHLLCQNPRITLPFSIDELALAKVFIASNITEQSPATRALVVFEFKCLMTRLRESYKVIKKQLARQDPQDDSLRDFLDSTLNGFDNFVVDEKSPATVLIKYYVDFLKFLHEFLFGCLIPEANFNRRIMALNFLHLVHDCYATVKNGDPDILYPDFQMSLWLTLQNRQSLERLLTDDYEIVQVLAEEALLKIPFPPEVSPASATTPINPKIDGFENFNKSRAYWRGFEKNISENADCCLSTLREIIIALNTEFDKAQANDLYLTDTVVSLPNLLTHLNGFLGTKLAKELLGNQRFVDFFATNVYTTCFELTDIVDPVVHSLAPEGYYPDREKVSNPMDVTRRAQQFLINCWRTHREISAIFKNIIELVFEKNGNQITLSPEMLRLVPPGTLKRMVSYLWLQLTECRHIGAFECSAKVFETLSTLLWQLEEDQTLPLGYYDETCRPEYLLDRVLSIFEGDNSEDTVFCRTRRSAGLPLMICALLISEPRSRGHRTFGRVVTRLIGFNTKDPVMAVHIINCLVSIFNNAAFCEVVRHYIAPALALCFQTGSQYASLFSASQNWPIRNALNRLFATVEKRMFGIPHTNVDTVFPASKQTKSANEVFVQMPQLYKVISDQLTCFSEGSDAIDELDIFPIGGLLVHITPSNTPEFSLNCYHGPLVDVLLRTSHQSIRQMAAAALLQTTTADELFLIVVKLRHGFETKAFTFDVNALEGICQLLILADEKQLLDDPYSKGGTENRRLLNKAMLTLLILVFSRLAKDLASLCDFTFMHIIEAMSIYADDATASGFINIALAVLQSENLGPKQMTGRALAQLIGSRFPSSWTTWGHRLPRVMRMDCYVALERNSRSEIDLGWITQAIADLKDATEVEIVKILALEKCFNDCENQSTVFSVIRQWTSVYPLQFATVKCLSKILVHLSSPPDLQPPDIKFIESFVDSALTDHCDAVRLEAVSLWLSAISLVPEEVVQQRMRRKALPWLQDDDVAIREAAASFFDSTSLNMSPANVWIMNATPDVLAEMATARRIKQGCTFEEIDENTFAEPFVDSVFKHMLSCVVDRIME